MVVVIGNRMILFGLLGYVVAVAGADVYPWQVPAVFFTLATVSLSLSLSLNSFLSDGYQLGYDAHCRSKRSDICHCFPQPVVEFDQRVSDECQGYAMKTLRCSIMIYYNIDDDDDMMIMMIMMILMILMIVTMIVASLPSSSTPHKGKND